MLRFIVVFAALIFLPTLHAQHSVAITIDDLPSAQAGSGGCDYQRVYAQTERLLAPFAKAHVPLVGFVITSQCKDLTDAERKRIFALWQQSGAELGSHTDTHPDLTTVAPDKYEADILTADAKLRAWLAPRTPRYFRHPYLHTGPTLETKTRIDSFLAAHNYTIAPVTIDNSDWMFAFVYRHAIEKGDRELAERVRAAYIPYMESMVEFFEGRIVEVTGHDAPQVLLMHANALNAEMSGELVKMFERRRYRFITLDEALRDPAYSMANTYAGKGGFSWVHRWSMAKQMPRRAEADEPKWLQEEYTKLSK